LFERQSDIFFDISYHQISSHCELQCASIAYILSLQQTMGKRAQIANAADDQPIAGLSPTAWRSTRRTRGCYAAYWKVAAAEASPGMLDYNPIFKHWSRYMHKPGLKLLAGALGAAFALHAHAVVTKVDVGTPLPRFALLKAGTHHYLRYMKQGEKYTAVDIWTREILFEQRGNEKLMHIRQRWDAVGATPSVKLLDSWFEATTFRPRTHERITEKDGKRVVEGFAFAPDKITGIADLADNAQKDLVVPSPEPTFNFETDIEFLQALPLAEGYEANINFYHAGGASGPARYLFKVVGSETIAGPSGPVDCWKLTTDYNRPGSVSTFWFAKATQLMVRQESAVGDRVLVKTLID
jgi:hypothetical protein